MRKGFEHIGATDVEPASPLTQPKAVSVEELILAGESSDVEFKSTCRWSLTDGKVHEGVELAIVKTVAGFLNTSGGTLVVGVADDGAVVGLDHDYGTFKKKDRDGFELFLYELLGNMLGKNPLFSIKLSFEAVQSRDVAIVSVKRSLGIVFTNPKGQKVDDVYVRFGNSTRKLTPAETLQYVSEWESGGEGKAPAAEFASDSLGPLADPEDCSGSEAEVSQTVPVS